MFDPGNMEKMMQQLGMEMEEVAAARVTVETEDGRELVFDAPQLHRMEVQGQTMFQLQGDYEERDADADGQQEDVELVMERADVSEEAARKALEEHDDLADAIMSLQ
ncbi:MAG: nascent polypeptide-associated complex protein [Candidatus Nanohaloarchaea archaeon]|nr:nascent polypeptide-associated complex protein [Candidatus Nanohaloarchaea archaeon]